MPKDSVEARFWAKVDKDGPVPESRPDLGPCWVWTAARTRGYGHFKYGRRLLQAHRWAFEQRYGLLMEGLDLDHLCRNRACVNPIHLEQVTRRENILRGDGLAAKQARQTHCKRGHPFDEVNTYLYNGLRVCRMCHRELQRLKAATRQEPAPEA